MQYKILDGNGHERVTGCKKCNIRLETSYTTVIRSLIKLLKLRGYCYDSQYPKLNILKDSFVRYSFKARNSLCLKSK